MRAIAASCLLGYASAQAPDYEAMWSKFKVDFGKTYDSNRLGHDEKSRYSVFKDNVDKISEHNKKKLSYWLGVNAFADLTAEEFADIYIGGYQPELRQGNRTTAVFTPGEPLDDAVDWVAKGGVTPVKNQQRCGSCWAFSTTGAVEGAMFAATGQLISLSEEDLVQCDKGADHGCQGGLMDHAFGWVKANGICAEEDYPYTSGGGVRGACRTPACTPVVTVSGHEDVPSNDEDALKAAVSKQTVSVAIEADKSAFQLYAGGVLDSAGCGKQLDHGVLLVGYGSDGGMDFWKVKNSWGPSWGEQGYIRMVRGKNMCGIAMQASYPTGASAAPPGPAPGPSPPAPPSPPTGKSHYGDPKDGCMSDEQAVQVQGIPGDFCSPDCSSAPCPSDVPQDVTAKPACALSGPSHLKKCALLCNHGSECGKGHCHHPHEDDSPGICTYDASEEDILGDLPMNLAKEEQVEIVV